MLIYVLSRTDFRTKGQTPNSERVSKKERNNLDQNKYLEFVSCESVHARDCVHGSTRVDYQLSCLLDISRDRTTVAAR